MIMEFRELLRFITIENERLKKYYDAYNDEEKHILARNVKLAEEVGELSEQVLFRSALQRKQKYKNHNKKALSEEFADVIITAMLLAIAMNIDIEKSIEKKIEKVNKRYDKK